MSDKQKIIDLENRIHRLNEIGMALSTESDSNKLFEMILEEARNITNADGRTLYSKNETGNLQFEILRNDTMNTTMGGSSGTKIPFDPVKLWVDESTPNQSNVSAYVALTGETVNENNFIGFYDSTVTIIDDDVKRPFLGMLSLGSSKTKYSLTNTFLTLTNSLFNFTTFIKEFSII